MFGFRFELTLAGFGEGVIFCPPLVLRIAPGGLEPAGFFHAVESRKERSRFHVEGALGDLIDPVRNAEAVERLCRQGLQDQEMERTLQEIRFFFHS